MLKNITFRDVDEYIGKRRAIFGVIALGAPFVLIPGIAMLLRIGVWVGDKLPHFLVVLDFNMLEPMSLSNFVYYYICFLTIEITGIFSFLIWKATIASAEATKASTEIAKATLQLNKQLLKKQKYENHKLARFYLRLVIPEIERNFGSYIRKFNGGGFFDGQSIKQYLEEDVYSIPNLVYKDGPCKFSKNEWDRFKKDIFELDPILGDQIRKIYLRFEILITNESLRDIDFKQFENFSHEVEEFLKKTDI